jgi:transcriptional regulator with XRE-family HTH domain
VRVGTLKAHERCFIMRRRCNKTQQEVAADMGICRYWLNRMELGETDCTDLACYWEA